jgi:UDP-3-O-[3-hydroxymyristoyl] glucosamine N-acyltransferase
MTVHRFFAASSVLTLADIVALTGAELANPANGLRIIDGLAVLDEAGPSQLTFLENPKYATQLAQCHAGACLVSARLEAEVPPHIAILRVKDPHRAFVALSRVLHPAAMRPTSVFGAAGVDEKAQVHPTARLEDDVIVDPMAVIGPDAEIGSGTVIGASAVIGPGVAIGRSCSIGANATIMSSLIGNGVIIHPGCRIGQDGFGFEMGARKHNKVPQTGRVIIQNDVEVGANTTIDRGALRDTVIGEGTKIDNLVQIGHNVTIGRLCIITSQVGISGSVTLGEGVVLGARVGVNNHLTIGDRAQIAATSIVHGDVPANARWGGTPAKPVRLWLKEMMMIERMAREPGSRGPARRSERDDKAGRKE